MENSDLINARANAERAKLRAQKSQGCGCFGESQSKKIEGAIELYRRAIVVFQREKQYSEAAKCFEEVAFLKEGLGDDAEEDYQEAAHCYSFVDKKKSVEVLKAMVRKYENEGKFEKAGESYFKVGQYFEEEKDFTTAVIFFEKAADAYKSSRTSKSKERESRLKFADLSCIHGLGAWKDFIDVYESVGKQYLLEPMLKYSAKEMFFKIVCLYALYEVSIRLELFTIVYF